MIDLTKSDHRILATIEQCGSISASNVGSTGDYWRLTEAGYLEATITGEGLEITDKGRKVLARVVWT
jgi:hypothetical protein